MKTLIYTVGYILSSPLILLKTIATIFALLNEWSNKIGEKIMLKNFHRNSLRK